MPEPRDQAGAGAARHAADRIGVGVDRPGKEYVQAGPFRLALHVTPPRGPLRAGLLLGHAMMCHAGVLRPLARHLALLGCGVWRLDFRGLPCEGTAGAGPAAGPAVAWCRVGHE